MSEPRTAGHWHSQNRHPVRLEWGVEGALALTRYAVERGARLFAVVVDVLSFSTSVSVATDAGCAVYPYRWGQEGAQEFADERFATLAMRRSETRDGGVSLSPRSIRDTAGLEALVLPSPNGSTITERLVGSEAVVIAGALRNRAAVGRWLADHLVEATEGEAVVVLVPAGERWPDGSLRPAVEDLWGAGAVADAVLQALGAHAAASSLSPEAEAARLAYLGVRLDVAGALAGCASGRELVESGWSRDVAIAGELDASTGVPVLHEGAFRRAALLPDGRPEG